jgi:hypothetical protein
LTRRNKKRTIARVESKARTEGTVGPDKRSAWLQKLDQECPYQITLPRRQLTDDAAIMDFLLSSHVGKFDMYVEDECAAYVRYCFADPLDAAIFRSRFEPKSEPFRLAGCASPRTAFSTKRPTIPWSPIGVIFKIELWTRDGL